MEQEDKLILLRMFISFIIGLLVGSALSYAFIFPPDLMDMKLVELTIGDALRIIAGIIAILIAGGLGIVVSREIYIRWR